MAKQAVDAGCDDPMVRYCQGYLLREVKKNYIAAHSLRAAYEAFLTSEYDISFHCWSSQYLAEAILVAGPRSSAEPYLKARQELLPRVLIEANYKKTEQRLLLDRLNRDYFGGQPASEAEANWQLVRTTEMNSWLKSCLEGVVKYRQAYEFRSSLSDLERIKKPNKEKFAEQLRDAHKHFLSAWDQDNTAPEPLTWIIGIMREQEEPLDSIQEWMDRAKAADFDYYPAYSQLRYTMQLRWNVSHKEMLTEGRKLLASQRFDTAVPFLMLQFAAPTIPKLDQPYLPLLAEGVYADLVAMAEGYLAEPTMAWTHRWMRSFLIALAWRCEQWDDGARFLSKTEGVIDSAPFHRLGVQEKEGIGEIAARSGDLSSQVIEADELTAKKEFVASLKIFERIRSETEDKPINAYLNRRIGVLRRQANFKGGKWVDLLPKKDLRDWWKYRGEWSVTEQGHLVGTSNRNGLLLVCNESFGVDYTLEGKVRFAKSHFSGENAGVYFGQPTGRYEMKFPYLYDRSRRSFRK